MNYDNVKDYRAQKALKKFINSSSKSFVLRTLANCGNVSSSAISGMSIIANHRHSRVVGAKMCGNSWACPVCTAIKMSRCAARIAAAIDALQETHNAIMITFTIFHSKNDSCQQAFDLLYNTWVRFTKRNLKERTGGLGTFMTDCEIRHRVRVGEVTFTENGWHPHFHCLFWVPKKHFNKVLSYEQKLRDDWRRCEQIEMKKIYGYAKYNAFYESEKLHGEAAAGVFISKCNGQPVIQKSSDYLCGWGADKELTGNYLKEATCTTSRTPYQLLNDAMNGDQTAIQLYLEFAEYIILHKRRRFDFGRASGLRQIIQQQINSAGYKEVMKKKRTQYRADAGEWRLVIWFSSAQWSEICRIDNNLDFSLIALLMCLAKYNDGYEMICEVLRLHNLPTGLNYDPVGYHDAFVRMINDDPYKPKDPTKTIRQAVEELLAG